MGLQEEAQKRDKGNIERILAQAADRRSIKIINLYKEEKQ